MKVTTDEIEEDLVLFFNPFVYIAVEACKTLGGFDVRLVNDTHIKFIIFDKPWESDSKVIIWQQYFDLRDYDNMLEFKAKIAPQIEHSIRTFCGI